MILLTLLILPVCMAALSLFFRGEDKRIYRRWIFLMTTLLHAGLVALLFATGESSAIPPFLAIDPLGLFFLGITSLLFVTVSIYSFGYFSGKQHSAVSSVSRFYTPCMLLFLSSATLATVAQNLGLIWVAIEATTLATAPLIYYHHTPRALEAAWKYLLICSVGIALALLGIFFIAAASRGAGGDLQFSTLILKARFLDIRWLRFGLILIFVGFGTKMGLAPLHTWLPDAHSEAPSPVSALLSGALLNCAFLAILRFQQIAIAAGLASFTSRLFILFGLISLFVSAVFILRQRDYKRLLAYSSVEHMGILALAIGVGAPFAALLHTLNHSLTKVLLFMTSGKILNAYGTKNADSVHGLFKTLPAVGTLFMLGGLAIVGSPPFGPFVSEFLILRKGLITGHYTAMFFYLVLLGIIFVAFTRIVLSMVQGEKRELPAEGHKPTWTMIAPAALLALAVLVLGVYLPPPLVQVLQKAATLLKEMT